MFRIAGILREQLSGDVLAFAAVRQALALTADGHRTFAVKRMPACMYAAAAAAGFFVFAAVAVKPAS